MERIVHERLEKEGLERLSLPLGAAPADRHVPVLVSGDLGHAARVVVVGEPSQDLGVLAGRVANGPGGLDWGSMVSVVRALRARAAPEPPAVVLANTGQRHWWPEGRRALTVAASAAVPLPSLVHRGRRHVPALNSVPGSEDPARHVRHVFERVLGDLAARHAAVSVVAVGEACELVTRFLDDVRSWAAWGPRLGAMLPLGHVYPDDDLTNAALKDFLAKRARAYVVSSEPVDTPLAPPAGNPYAGIPNLGCSCYSSGEPQHIETTLVRALAPALRYLEVAATTPGFENPPIEVVHRPERGPADDWGAVPDELRLSVSAVDQGLMREQVRQARRWRKFAETGRPPLTYDDSD